MKIEDLAEIAKQRNNIYGFLAIVYIKEPNNEFIKLLKKPDIFNSLRRAGIKLNKKIKNINEEELLEGLVLEYNRLFIGPGKHIPLYESVWLDNEGLLWGKATSEVKRFIESFGLKYHQDWTGIPDHIGVELEFMQKLTEREAEAWKQKDKTTAFQCLEFEKKFLDEHLYQWIPKFCNKVIEESNNSFYGQGAKLTKKFIEFDKKHIQGIIEKKDKILKNRYGLK